MNIYFSGIGGVGIGPLAEIALDAGYDVLGSDLVETTTTAELINRRVKVNVGQDGSFLNEQHKLKPIDWFIYTAALPQDHPELVLAKNLGIKCAKRDELLSFIIKDKNLKLIAIAGTHGKTTTAGMMVWAMQKLDIPISYSVGTTFSFGPSGKFDPKSKYFIYECDEFDRNFLNFQPFLSLITTIDYDHPDTYPTEKDYLDSFTKFAQQSQKVITWQDQHNELFANIDNITTLHDSDINESLKLAGEHNRRNASLVQKAILELEINQPTDDILSDFPGVSRRFEKLADNLYSDYGHHPVEIAATLQMAHELYDDIILVYQPHQNVRQHAIKDQYTNQFELAKDIYWLPTFIPAGNRDDHSLAILSPEELTRNITNQVSVHIAELDDKLWQTIQQARQNNRMVLCMGASNIDTWVREKLKSTEQLAN
jgi:UDP-N-acetylmuramate--alanine ligase